MARNIGRAGTRITGVSTAVTMLQLVASSTIDTVVRDISVTFDGTVVTNAPIDTQTLFQSTAGTPAGTTPAPTKVDNRTGTALLATAGFGAFSGEPTAGNEVFRWHIHPQTGQLWQGTPYMDEIVIVASANRLGTKFATAPSASIDTNIYYVFEE
jgi:hypothetical protein